jgi:ribonuclease HepT-like protein
VSVAMVQEAYSPGSSDLEMGPRADGPRTVRGVTHLDVDAAGIRNVLVHGYLAVDLPRMHGFLNSGLDDFAEFARFIEDYLRRV